MDLADMLSYVAMFVGLASSIFFGIGAYNTKDSTIVEISALMWGRGARLAQCMIEQKYDYMTGASLLVISFSSQLTSRLISDSSMYMNLLEEYSFGIFYALCLSILFTTLVRCVANRLKKSAIAAHTEKIKEDTKPYSISLNPGQ